MRVPFLVRERRGLLADASLRGFIVFWGCFFFAMAVGAINGAAIPAWEAQRSIHDALAFGFASLLSVTALAYFRRHAEEAKDLLAIGLVVALIMNIGLWLAAKFQLGAMSASFMYSPVRFRGLAINPNQLALILVGMPFIGWYFLEAAESLFAKMLSIVAIAVAVFLGVQTGSDALKVSILVGVALLAINGANSVWRRGSGWKWRVVALGVILGVYFLSDSIIVGSDGLPQNIAADKGVRFALWRHAFEAWLVAPIFGLGPGAWSGIDGPFEGLEAHNSFLDVGMSAGAIGLLTYLIILGWVALRFVRNKCYLLLIIGGVLIIYSFFHYVLRNPFFWGFCVMLLCLCPKKSGNAVQDSGCLTNHDKTCAA